MLKHLDHVGIAVANLEEAVLRYEQLLGSRCYKRERVESEQVETAFFRQGETKLELLGATGPESVITRFIEKRGEGLHHIAYEVDDIHAEMLRLTGEGYRLLNDFPKKGADNKLIVFVHPKDAGGVLMELCQAHNPDP
ncbi:MAG: methylmalonyl-CoA/ethylmalonyl-CoA epimerase Epi [Bacteroidetes bacterium HLUCCA01]|nr:MAG: methylmalonyl-CoA/ethylmalonyl-CoA epimerase Epi [Bacteroidetes bacterium HLUCCA01]